MAATNGADVAVAVLGPPAGAPEVDDQAGFKLKFCTVCASNQNRCVTYAYASGLCCLGLPMPS